MCVEERRSDYYTDILEYDYFEHARVRVLIKLMYSSTSTVTLQCTVLEYNYIRMKSFMITFMINEYPISNIKATFMEPLDVIIFCCCVIIWCSN